MSKRKSKAIVGRLGVRYGVTVRQRVGQIEVEMRKKHRCESCRAFKVKRVSVGVWKCGKCGYTFSGAAYTPTSKIGETIKRNVKRVSTSL
jgi:large subunit ribosomal protein L37Ae